MGIKFHPATILPFLSFFLCCNIHAKVLLNLNLNLNYLRHAFRLCPVSPSDWDFLGMHWQGKFYVYLCLPFGFHSSPFLFNGLANASEWIHKNNYNIQALMHYLDDYFTDDPPSSPLCGSQVQTMVNTTDHLDIPLAPDMTDYHLMEFSLPSNKLSKLLSELQA